MQNSKYRTFKILNVILRIADRRLWYSVIARHQCFSSLYKVLACAFIVFLPLFDWVCWVLASRRTLLLVILHTL
jgi:hypothetical protein